MKFAGCLSIVAMLACNCVLGGEEELAMCSQKGKRSNARGAHGQGYQGLPSARGCPVDEGFYFTMDFLWWKAVEDDFSLGFHQQVTSSDTIGAQGEIIRFNFDWDPGFKVGLGYNTPYDGWDAYLNWTWYRGGASRNLNVTTTSTGGLAGGQGIVPFWLIGAGALALPSAYGSLTANWHVLLNMADLELARDFFVGRHFSLRPLFGVRGGWIDRNWKVSYGNINPAFINQLPAGTYSNESNYWGVGPRVGLSGDFRLPQQFRVFGLLSASLLSGKVFENEAKEDQRVGTDPTNFSTINDASIWKVVPHLQLMTGLGWADCIYDNKLLFGLKAGWEVNYYWNLPMAIYPDYQMTASTNLPFNRENRCHNLSMSGLTFEARLDY